MGRARVAAISILYASLTLGAMAPAGAGQGTGSIAVSAAPRWGLSVPGMWTPYVVTVQNGGADDIEGDVFLVPETPPPPPPGSRPQAPLYNRALALRPGGLISSSEELPEVGRLEARAALPAPPPWPTYRSHLALARGSAKTLTMLVLEAPFGYRVELRDAGGRHIAAAPVAPRPESSYAVALLSNVVGAAAVVEGLAGYFASRVEITQIKSARDFPDDVLFLSGLDAVVLDDFDTASLDPKQVGALRDFVAFGGSLVLGGGPAWQRTLASLPDELVPLHPFGTTTSSLLGLADLVGRASAPVATVVTGELRRGRAVLQAPNGPPLVTEAPYGAGGVVQLSYDPFSEPFASDATLAALAWDQGLARGLSRVGRPIRGPARMMAPEDYLWAPLLERSAWPSWPRWSLGLLGLYVVLLASGSYLMLRSARRRELVWAVVPVASLVVAAAVGMGGRGGANARKAVVEVATLSPDGAVLTTTYQRLSTWGRPERRTETLGGAGAASTVFVQPGIAQSGETFMDERVLRGAGRGEVLYGSGGVQLQLGEFRPWGLRTAQTISLDHARAGLEADLRLLDSGGIRFGRSGRIVGTVTNRGTEALHRLHALLPEGGFAFVAEVVPPGTTIQVDTTLGSPTRLTPSSQREKEVMLGAASRAFMRSGQIALLSLNESRPAPNAASLRVTVQALPLAGADPVVAYSRVVSALPSDSGWVAMYEANVFDESASGRILYLLAQGAFMDVYDWHSGTWRRLPPPPGGGPAEGVLAPGEIGHGIVRVRAHAVVPFDKVAMQVEVGEPAGAG